MVGITLKLPNLSKPKFQILLTLPFHASATQLVLTMVTAVKTMAVCVRVGQTPVMASAMLSTTPPCHASVTTSVLSMATVVESTAILGQNFVIFSPHDKDRFYIL